MTGDAPAYVRGPVERFGRRIKLEYVGMVSVYLTIAFLVFRGLPGPVWALVGGVGSLFLFLGLKKKTRDHISGSLVLFAAAWLARPAVVHFEWVVPFLLFAACVCALEGYLEKRQEQILVLPLVFFGWGWLDFTWVLGLAFVALYLTHPWTEKPGQRRRLAWILLAATAASLAGVLIRSGAALIPDFSGGLPGLLQREPPGSRGLLGLVALGVPTIACLAIYWRRLPLPHRLSPILFGLLAPWDVRWMAMFAMVAAVLLTATVFRLSIDSPRLRPYFKHAEWHYFWYVFALALWTMVTL